MTAKEILLTVGLTRPAKRDKRITQVVPLKLHKLLKAQADRQNVSINELLNRYLAECISKYYLPSDGKVLGIEERPKMQPIDDALKNKEEE